MTDRHFSLILLATLQCNADCAYCFEDKTEDRLTLPRLTEIIDKVLVYLEEEGIGTLTLYWQGGEALLLPPGWYAQAHERIQRAADRRGITVRHSLQTNLLAYSPKWNGVIAEMFGNSVGTSADYPMSGSRGAAARASPWDPLTPCLIISATGPPALPLAGELRQRVSGHRRPRPGGAVRLLGDQLPGLRLRRPVRQRQPGGTAARQPGPPALRRTANEAGAGGLHRLRLSVPVPWGMPGQSLHRARRAV